MKRIIASLVLILACSCGDSAGPDDDDNVIPSEAQPTAVGTPTGQATSGSIGPVGGTLASADGLFSLTIPAGALAATTDITIQPITNTAWGGTGDGYRLLPDGLTFASPVELEFTVNSQVLAETPPDFLDVAVQSAEGYWYILKNRSYDANSRRLTATTRHFSDYSALQGLQLRPASAGVAPGGIVLLNITYCSQQSVSGGGGTDDDLIALLNNCTGGEDGLVPVSTFTNWSVNGISGGNNSVGRVVEVAGGQARYTAPASAPQSNPVAVSVRTPRRRNTETLVSNITIGSAWLGTTTVDFGGGEKIQATVVWKHVGTFGNVEFYDVHSGSIVYSPDTDFGPLCSFVSFTPTTAIIQPIDGQLFINNSTNPPTFTGAGTTLVQNTVSWTCAGMLFTESEPFSFSWFAPDPAMTETPLKADGSISHSFGTAGNSTAKYTISFTRGVLPAPAVQVSGARPPWLRVGSRE